MFELLLHRCIGIDVFIKNKRNLRAYLLLHLPTHTFLYKTFNIAASKCKVLFGYILLYCTDDEEVVLHTYTITLKCSYQKFSNGFA